MINVDEALVQKILNRGRYYAYMGASVVCHAASSINIQKAIRSRLGKSRLKYLSVAAAMSLAGTASSDKASEWKRKAISLNEELNRPNDVDEEAKD
jgi:hypothetical protein